MYLRPNNFLSTVSATIFLIGVAVISSGCNQNRYQPAQWRAAARKTTVPVREEVPGDLRWTSLPKTRMGSLPLRSPGGWTLPNRGMGGTLPMRNWSTLPGGRGMTTLPQRRGRWDIRQNWGTLPNRGGVGGMNTLPRRQTYPEYSRPRRNWSTLPGASDRQPIPFGVNNRPMPFTSLPR